MSYEHLQRVVVRMLYDPAFVARIFADPCTALRGEALTAQERRWLVEVDRRAYAVDPLRRARTLAALIEEFPVSVHALVRQTGQPALLEAFFNSAFFHRCIQQRGSLATAFSEYLLADHWRPRTPGWASAPFVQLEMAIARLRRQSSPSSAATPTAPQPLYRLSPAVSLLSPPRGTLAHYQAALDLLRGDADGLVAAACKPSVFPGLQEVQEHEWLLIVWHCELASAAVELLPEALGQLLAATPAPRAALVATACTLGAETHEAQEILDGLVADGVLCCADSPAG